MSAGSGHSRQSCRVATTPVGNSVGPINWFAIAMVIGLAGGCASAPDTVDDESIRVGVSETDPNETVEPQTSWQAMSREGLYAVRITPESGAIEIGPIRNWVLNLRNWQGDAIYPARITVGGGMAGHGHGLPTQPLVTAYGGDGDYLVEGVRFSMAGDWRLSFLIDSQAGRDRVDFELSINY